MSVVVCTRDRGDAIVKTIGSILQSDYPEFDVLVIDQSTGTETLDALQTFVSDERFRYLRSMEVGVSRSRTLGLVEATSELVLMTDDDCTVPLDWVRANVEALLSADAPAIVFGDVVAQAYDDSPGDDSPGDDSPGDAPQSVAEHDFVVTSLSRWWAASDGVNVGVGASMAIRRSVGLAVGGFDHQLGTGSPLRALEVTDLTLRILLSGHSVMHTTRARVENYGARGHDDVRSLTRGAMLGLGAVCGKLVRWKPLPMLRFIFRVYWRLVVVDGLKALARFRSAPMLDRASSLTKGIWIGLRRPVDSARHLFGAPGSRVTFIMEQQVGLKSYSDNLRRFIDRDARLEPSWAPVTYDATGGIVERLPLPAGLRGPLRGRAQVRRALRGTTADACLFLTQTPVALGGRLARRRPYVVMLDDTPILYDRMAQHYGEQSGGSGPVAAFKHRTSAKGLCGAHRVLPMSDWARSSLIADYGVDPDRISVVPTGIDLDQWRPRDEERHDGPPRILFVGGHLERKGGQTLLEAFRRLSPGTAELHIVTRSEVPTTPGVHVHRGLEPNSPALVELFASSDIFVLPSLAEAFPNVVVEACASGLPAIVTDVGGMAEMVVDGETGFVIPPQDVDELERHLQLLLSDADLRSTMARAARARAEKLYDGRTNAALVADWLLDACGHI